MSDILIPTIRIAVCDDEKSQIDIVVGYLEELKKVYTNLYYDVYLSGSELVEHYQRSTMEEHYDLIFLDVEMPGDYDGLSVATKLREFDADFSIVFITRHEKYVWDSFCVTPLDFLTKPIDQDKFNAVFERGYNKITDKHNLFAFTCSYDRVRVFTRKIIYFESYYRKITLKTTNGTYEFNGRMKSIFNSLNHDFFIMPHRSYVVNMSHIQRLEYEQMILHNGEIIPISVHRTKEAKEALRLFDIRRCGL